MRILAIAGLIASCGNDGPDVMLIDAAPIDAYTRTTYNCLNSAMQVTQYRTPCTVLTRGNLPLDNQECPFVQWAYCGDAASCPADWTLECSTTNPGHECFYKGACTVGLPADETALFDTSQQLVTTRGMLVFFDPDDLTKCEFRACQ